MWTSDVNAVASWLATQPVPADTKPVAVAARADAHAPAAACRK
jgi:hypothetical protein